MILHHLLVGSAVRSSGDCNPQMRIQLSCDQKMVLPDSHAAGHCCVTPKDVLQGLTCILNALQPVRKPQGSSSQSAWMWSCRGHCFCRQMSCSMPTLVVAQKQWRRPCDNAWPGTSRLKRLLPAVRCHEWGASMQRLPCHSSHPSHQQRIKLSPLLPLLMAAQWHRPGCRESS